jgi:hypothetical protein
LFTRINRYLNPIVPLTSEEEIDSFIEMENEWKEKTDFMRNDQNGMGVGYKNLTIKMRAIVFFPDKSEYKNEYKNVKQAAEDSGNRDDLRVGIVTDRKLVKLYKDTYGLEWFPSLSSNCIVLFKQGREKNRIYDLQTEQLNVKMWLNK